MLTKLHLHVNIMKNKLKKQKPTYLNENCTDKKALDKQLKVKKILLSHSVTILP